MIEISVSAIKGGYRELFQTTPTAPRGIASMIRPDSGSPFAVGQEAYAISFQNAGFVCTKCKIIRDVLGGSRVGNIAFSVFMPANKALSGKDIKSLLDELLREYCSRERNYIDKDYNLGNVYEDWTFVNSLVNLYKTKTAKDKSDVNMIQQGTLDAAFIYYSSDEEMQKYFDDPFQNEYTPYKQVLFVAKNLEGKDENPLNALRHSMHNLTGKVDLENYQYTLLIKRQEVRGLNIEVKVDGKVRNNRDKIRRKQVLTIKYSQAYRKEDIVKGIWEDVKQKKPNCIDIDTIKETITINWIDLRPEIQTIQLTVKNRVSKEIIHDFEAICRSHSNRFPQKTNKNPFVFEGDEIGTHWSFNVQAKGYDNYKSDRCFMPSEKTNTETVYLDEKRTVIIDVVDRKNNQVFPSNDYELKIYNKYRPSPRNINYKEEKNKITFVGDEIDEEWYIEVNKRDYKVSGEKPVIRPRHENEASPIKIYIEKKHPETVNERYRDENGQRNFPYHIKQNSVNFSFSAGKNGSLDGDVNKSYTADGLPPYRDNNYIEDYYNIAPVPKNKCFKFVKWKKIKHENNNYNFQAQFKLKTFVLVLLILLILLTILGIAAILYSILIGGEQGKGNQPHVTKNQIENYTSGIILNIDTLNYYKDIHNQIPNEQDDEIGSSQLGSGGKKETTTLYSKIIDAIEIRNAIDSGKIDELKAKPYSPAQKKFKEAIQKIDTALVDQIGQLMRVDTMAKMDLDQIADYIGHKIDSINPSTTSTFDGRENGSSTNNTGTTSANNNSGITQEITDYLKGRELEKDTLGNFRGQTKDKKLQESIDLALEFWELDGRRNNTTYCAFQKKIAVDRNFNESILKKFVEKMCENNIHIYGTPHKKEGLANYKEQK